MMHIFTDRAWIEGWVFFVIVLSCYLGGFLMGWYARKENEKQKRRKGK